MEDLTEDWSCARCGAESHDAIEFPTDDSFPSELEVDVTCQSVYITPVSGGDGFAFTHSEFRGVMQHFEESEYTK